MNKYDINDIKAESNIPVLISTLVVLLLMILAIYFLWDYSTSQLSSLYLIPVALLIVLFFYTTLIKESNKKIQYFNKSQKLPQQQ